MKKLFFTFSVLLSLALTVNAQIPSKVWLFDTPEWSEKQLFNAPEVVDDLAILADSLAPVTIENTNKVFAHPEWPYNFTKALRLGGPAFITPEMPLLPIARAVVFQMNGPGYIHIICLSSTLEPSQLLITDGKQMLHRITVPGNDYVAPNGSQLPAYSYYHTRGISPIFIYAENGSVDLFCIEAETGLVDPDLPRDTVTFNVNVPAGTKECWVAGSFNGWNSNAYQMQMVDSVNYMLTIPDINVSTIEYKYLSGPDWKYGECNTFGQEIPNRTHQLNDTVANWFSIYDPGTQTSVTYTVKVPLGTNQVCIAGDFNNWIPSMHWMQQIDSVTYQITIQGATENMEYKYFNGPNWSFEEVSITGQPLDNRTWTPLDQVAAWSNMIAPEQTRIFYDDIHTSTGEDIAIDIRISSNQPRQAIAYQFEFHFDASTLEYTGYTTQGTVANSGEVVVNSTKDVGVLYISFMTTQAFDIINSLIKLNFKVVNNYSYNQTSAWFYEFYLDDQQIHGYNPGTIFIANFMLGDVDANQRVQAYDAALTLQYSVGMDPLPTIAPRPWEGWRLNAADVDGVAGITANDAAMILQYSAYLITSFDGDEPDSGSVRAPANKLAQVEIVRDQNMLYFKSYGNLVGFNLFIAQDLDAFGVPVISNEVSMKAVNVGSDIYAVGLAKLQPFADGTTFMTIPLIREISSDFEYKMFVNSDEVDVKAYAQTGVSSLADAGISLHPNPVKDIIRLNNLKDGSLIRVYDISGRMVLSTETFASFESIDVRGLANGIYSISILNNGSNAVSKFIKY